MDMHLFGHSWVQTILRHGPFCAGVHLCETFLFKTLIQPLHNNSRKPKNFKMDIILRSMISKNWKKTIDVANFRLSSYNIFNFYRTNNFTEGNESIGKLLYQ